MKLLLEKWRQVLNEEEQTASDKATVLANADKEVEALINKVRTAAQNDEGLIREALESIIQGLQNALESL